MQACKFIEKILQHWCFPFTSWEFKSTSYEFKFTSYEFKSTSYEFKSTGYEIFLSSHQHKTLCCAFKLLLPGTVNFSTSYQRWLFRQWLLIGALCLCLVPSLIFRPTLILVPEYIGMKMLFSLQIFTRN